MKKYRSTDQSATLARNVVRLTEAELQALIDAPYPRCPRSLEEYEYQQEQLGRTVKVVGRPTI